MDSKSLKIFKTIFYILLLISLCYYSCCFIRKIYYNGDLANSIFSHITVCILTALSMIYWGKSFKYKIFKIILFVATSILICIPAIYIILTIFA